MPNVTDERTILDVPKAVILDTCEFPIEEDAVDRYRVLRLPPRLTRIFHAGASIIRINSLEIANAIPDFGGKASGEEYSLPLHQDHLDPFGDKRRILILTKHTDGSRGGSTLVMNPAIASRVLPLEEAWVTDDTRRVRIGRERKYDKRFQLTPEQYDRCFDHRDGYEEAITAIIGKNANAERELSVRLGILGFLIRGPSADELMEEVVQSCEGKFHREGWERGGVLMIDNSSVFHARQGGNEPALQRNYGIVGIV